MATQPGSKWAIDDDEAAQAATQRKKEREERKRFKEEKARKAAIASSISNNGDIEEERPAKRQRTSPQPEPENEEGAYLLQFPTRSFGPCGSLEQFEQLNNIEEGSYGMVSRARRKATGTIVALKHLKMEHTADGFPVTGLREIQTLKACKNPNVVTLLEVAMGSTLKE